MPNVQRGVVHAGTVRSHQRANGKVENFAGIDAGKITVKKSLQNPRQDAVEKPLLMRVVISLKCLENQILLPASP
jgi:hypothetical protein